MNIKSFTTSVFLLGLFAFVVAAAPLTAQEEQAQEAKIVIPEQVKAALQAGMEARQPRLDIPFTFVDKNIYLPAQMNLHKVFFFKVKNADMGFTAPPQPAEKKEETEVSSFESQPAMLQARCHIFFHYQQLDGNFQKEVYIPLMLQADPSDYDPEKEQLYTTGYPLPAGRYLLSMAIASQNLQKIGTQYYEFTLPDPTGYTEELGVTPVFFVNKMDRMSAPETQSEIHQDFFTYSVLQVQINMDNEFAPEDNLDVFFFIFGAQANAEGRNDIEVAYEVLQGEEAVIRYAQTKYDLALVSQPLPLKRTVLIKTTKEGKTTERQEQRNLDPGTYTLSIDIKDNLSGKNLKKMVEFTVK